MSTTVIHMPIKYYNVLRLSNTEPLNKITLSFMILTYSILWKVKIRFPSVMLISWSVHVNIKTLNFNNFPSALICHPIFCKTTEAQQWNIFNGVNKHNAKCLFSSNPPWPKHNAFIRYVFISQTFDMVPHKLQLYQWKWIYIII